MREGNPRTFSGIEAFCKVVARFFTEGHQRTLKAKRNIVASLLIKVANTALGFILVPVSLSVLNQTEYGVWLTVGSFIHWFNLMDIGLGKGLRNRFAEAIANGNHEEAKKYVSTTYAILGLITLAIISLFIIINPFINWSVVLNTSAGLQTELSLVVAIVFIGFALRFVLNLIGTLLTAHQQPARRDLIMLFSKIFITTGIFIMYHNASGSLVKFALIYSFSPVLLLFLSTPLLFATTFRRYTPSFEYVDFSKVSDLLKLGFKFFFISIGGIVLFQTDNIIIAQLFGPEKVTPYQIAHRYFGLSLMLFMIIVEPLWSATTDAFTKGDFDWIKHFVKKLLTIGSVFFAGTVLMLIVSPYVYRIWLGGSVEIPFVLSLNWMIFVILQIYNSIFTYFINGISKLRLQLIITTFSIIANIPLSILFASVLGLGISGVILATSVSMLLNLILKSIQYAKVITKTANGIWLK